MNRPSPLLPSIPPLFALSLLEGVRHVVNDRLDLLRRQAERRHGAETVFNGEVAPEPEPEAEKEAAPGPFPSPVAPWQIWQF